MSGLEIIVGTYACYTVGYTVEKLKSETDKWHLKQTFTVHNHTSPLKSLATFDKYLASGGSDDRICVYDLLKRQEVDQFLYHDGSVNTLAFAPDGSYLLSGGGDGKMIATNAKTWQVDKVWERAHKGSGDRACSVEHISIHPTGQMALSIGTDVVLKTWNLVTGRQVHASNLKNKKVFGGSLLFVEWSTDGEHFALVGNRVVEIMSVETTRSVKTLTFDCKPSSVCWTNETEIIVGLDDGNIHICDIEEGIDEMFKVCDARVKCIAACNEHIVTAASDGIITLWRFNGQDLIAICSTDIGCRPTCLAVVDAAKYGLENNLKGTEEEVEKTNRTVRKIHSVGVVTVETEHDDATGKEARSKKKKKQKKKSLEKEGADETIEKSKNKKKRNKIEENDFLEESQEIKVPKKKKKLDENTVQVTPKKKEAQSGDAMGSVKKSKKKTKNRETVETSNKNDEELKENSEKKFKFSFQMENEPETELQTPKKKKKKSLEAVKSPEKQQEVATETPKKKKSKTPKKIEDISAELLPELSPKKDIRKSKTSKGSLNKTISHFEKQEKMFSPKNKKQRKSIL